MGNPFSKLFKNKPFPVNSGPTQVLRTIERTKAAYGPSKMPHKQPRRPYARDAMGRIVVEDGDGRLRVHWPDSHAGVCTSAVSADFLFSILLWNTDKLNDCMRKQKMLGFCIIDTHQVVMLYNVPYDKACKKSPEVPAGIEASASTLPDSENRLSEAQLQEVVGRLTSAYLEYGVGALVLDGENGFFYQVMVPNGQEYAKHKAAYDAREILLRAAADERLAGSKRTRNGTCFSRAAGV